MITNNTSKIMLQVTMALLPGIILLTYFFGQQIIYNIVFASVAAISLEALCLKLRNKNIFFHLQDYSAIVTAVLLTVSLPPHIGLFKIFLGLIFAIVITKHLYGGLGHNIFNPAMIGFIVLIIAFPQDFTNWSLINSWSINNIDDISQATPLDPAFISKNTFDFIPYYIINLGWLIGGIYLLYKKLVPISLPLGFILGILITSVILTLSHYQVYNPIQQLLLGGSMLGAFFIVTDPVTASATPTGRWVYSILAGCFCILIRDFCGYPDGIAFAIVFMNTWVPLINKLTIKPAFGKPAFGKPHG